MSNNIVTLFLDDSSIRLLVSSGKHIKKWGELPLEPGLVNGGVVTAEAEIAEKIKHFFQAHKVRAKKVIVGLSGLHCLTRPIIFPQLPRAMLADAVIREAKKALPIPLEQLYLSWQTISASEGKTQVFLVAIQRNPADSLIRTLQQAGLRPYLMDLKPLSLARVTQEATAVIVDVQSTEFDIVIMADGVPQPIRTVSFSGGLSRQEKILVVKEELDRTIEFFNSNNKEKPLASDVKVFVSGELADESELPKLLSDEFKRPVSPLPSPVKSPEGFSPTRYLINIGLALKELHKEAGPLQVNLNLLPSSPQARKISKVKIIALAGTAVAIGLLIPLVILIQKGAAETVSINSQLTTTHQLIGERLLQKQELQGSIAELEKQVVETEATHSALTAVLGGLEAQGSGINQNLRTVMNNLPDTIILTRISYASERLTIGGQALNEAVVSSYALRLDASDRFAEIIVSNMKRTTDGKKDFTLTLITGG